MRDRRGNATLLGAALALLIAGPALGQQSKAQQKCINGLNTDSGKVAVAQAKNVLDCVKAVQRGTGTASCLSSDGSRRVGRAEDQTNAHEARDQCTSFSVPGFGYGGRGEANSAGRARQLSLFSDVFGGLDPTAAISATALEGGCQKSVLQRLQTIAAAQWKQFRACVRAALKGGATSPAALSACVQGAPLSVAADPSGKIAAATAALQSAIGSACTGVSVPTTFAGTCAAAPLSGLASCLGAAARCRLCQAANSVDRAGADCDLFDDGAANGSCLIPMHTCTLGAGSALDFHLAAFSLPLTVGITGSLNLGADGLVTACSVQSINPTHVPGIGYFCVTPGPACATGNRHCGPSAPAAGPPLGVDVRSFALGGSCFVGNLGCALECVQVCANAGSVPLGSGCTDRCTGSTPADMACTSDAQCAAAGNGACHGQDDPLLMHADICQCSCVDPRAFGGSDPGDLQCNLGVDIAIEQALPCDGTDATVVLSPSCIPLSTQEAKGKLFDANLTSGAIVPPPSGSCPGGDCNDQTGTPLACTAFDSGALAGLRIAGATGFFGSALGDVSLGVRGFCQ